MACLAQGYKLADAEANTLLPCLVEKSGHSQVRPPSKPYRNFHCSLERELHPKQQTPQDRGCCAVFDELNNYAARIGTSHTPYPG